VVKQIHWRIGAAFALFVCAMMAMLGVEWEALRLFLRQSVWFFLGYWSLFFFSLFAALYIALIDIRYIRLQYYAEKRAIFRETLGDELLRNALNEALRKRQTDLLKSRRN